MKTMAKIKDLKVGDYFTLKDCSELEETPSRLVWVRGEYDRSSKTYSCYKFDDVCHEHNYKGDKDVFTDFNF